ncbi:MAG: HutD family protein [Reichenbachiella sp.]|uniref:HutD/Ves family protein n=1 Tax=Reichenbachiella sp. TaxID=2184521 RepID=UPI003296802E
MKVKHLKPDPSKTITWAKGMSQELFIYPRTADFQKRDLLFRISLATVEAEESDFTPLPGIQRTLMLLKGKHKLTHQGHHTKTLMPFDQDNFMGDWQTSSQGKSTNFNLMCRAGTSGILKHVKGIENSETTFELKADVELIYLYVGSADYNGEEFMPGDCLVIENRSREQLKIACVKDCEFVQTSVTIKET